MIGQKLHNRYTITERIGKGAMGTVFRATDSQSGQDVALKVISAELTVDPEMLERFKREGEALRKLKHPNIVGFIDAFHHEENYVIVMEFVSHGNLNEMIKEGPMSIEDARRIALELCDALSRSHHVNIIHRDIKPENILIDQDGTPRLADFGVARLSEGTRMTRSGTQVGTPYYMAPEAWEGKLLTGQADIWSLGVVLFEMLAGQVPFGGDTGAAVMTKVLTTLPPDLKKLRPDVPPGLVKIIKRMLSRDNKVRYQTMREVAVDLERGQQVTIPARAKIKMPPFKMPSWLPGATIVGLVLIVLGVIFATQTFKPVSSQSVPTVSQAGEAIATGNALQTIQASNIVLTSTLSPAGGAIATANALKTVQASSINSGDPVQIRWYVGLGAGTNPEQVTVEEEVVADFNASQDHIELVLEIVPFDSARDTLATEIASGSGPDIVGPVGWGGSNDFYGQWVDIAPYIEELGFDTSIFDPALVKFYKTEEGQVGLPFAVFPGALYFRPDMFDQAGLAYPPQVYGEKYTMPDGSKVDWDWDTVTDVAKLLTLDTNGLNATEAGFNSARIAQAGYYSQWQSVLSIGTFYGGASQIYSGTEKGSFESTLPDSWKEGWKWYYDGMYGRQPFIPNGPLAATDEFGNGNIFNAGKVAIALTQSWYTCCLGDFANAGLEFQLGIQPMGADGEVYGRVDADTIRILKGSAHPREATEVLLYLITTGGDKLLPVYGAMPAISSKTSVYLDAKSNDYPFVTDESWNVFIQGLSYPDTPSSEQYQPNSIKANARFAAFLDLMNNTQGLDFDAEFQKLVRDLTSIYNQ